MKPLQALPLLVLAVGVTIALWAGDALRRTEQGQADLRFRTLAGRAISQLHDRVRTYEYGLRGARGVVIGAGGTALTHDQFLAYSRSRDIRREFPGALGFGFVRRVPPAGLAAFEAASRRDGRPDFAVHGLAPWDGEHFVITFIEPVDLNRNAVGLDIASEPSRREAALVALASDEPVLTAPIALVQARGEDGFGFLMLLRVTDPAERDGAIGWVYAPLTIGRILAGFDDYGGALAMAITDVTVPAAPVTILGDPGSTSVSGAPATVTEDLHLYGRTWRVDVRELPGFSDVSGRRSPQLLSAALIAGTALLAGLLYAFLANEARKHEAQLERELNRSASDRRFRDLAERVPHLLWTCDGAGACDYLSPQWLAYTGVPEEKQLGDGWLAQVHPDDADRVRATWAEATGTGSVYDVEFRIRRHDGVYRWFKARAHPVFERMRVVKWVGTNTDIQDLRNAHELTANLARELEWRVDARTQQLARVAEQLSAAQRISHVGSWQIDLRTFHGTWSNELFRIVGLPIADHPPRGHALRALLTRRSWRSLVSGIRRTRRTGEPLALTLDVVRPNGEQRTVVVLTEGSAPGAGWLVGALQDVTEVTEARQALVKVSERLQLATSAAGMGIWDWDIRKDVLVWDDTMYRLYGVEHGSPDVFERWRASLHPSDRDAAVQGVLRVVAEGSGLDTGFRIVRPSDGATRYLRAAAACHRDPETGAVVRLVGINWDVTDQHQVEDALRRSEATLRGTLAHAGSAILATDANGTLTQFNRAAERMLGYDASEVIGAFDPSSFHVPAELDERRRELEAGGARIRTPFDALASPARTGAIDAREWRYVRKDGSRLSVLVTFSALRDGRGDGGGRRISGYLAVAVDLTAQKQEEERLVALNHLLAERTEQAEAANQTKSLFLANMSHEIRTPINAIVGITHILGQSELTRDQLGLLDRLRSATKTLLGMINDVLDLSKIEAHQFTLEPAPFALSRVVDDVAGLLSGCAATKDIELIVDTDPVLPVHVVGDALRVTQILANLVTNAVRFTDTGHVRLLVGVERRDDGDGTGDGAAVLRFEVEDTGIGIDPGMIGRLFQPFTQAHSGWRRAGGTGLELALVKKLAGLMGGDTGVRSEVGRGSVFWCTLPFGVRPSPALGGRAERVLIAVDHPLQRRALSRACHPLGWQPTFAGTVDAAIAAADAADAEGMPFGVVLVDRLLEGADLLASLGRLRARQPGLLVLLLVSPLDRAAPGAERFVACADAVLTKPITTSALSEAVRRSQPSGARPTVSRPERTRMRLAGLRLLIVDDSEINLEVGRRILAADGARVEVAEDGAAAIAWVERQTFDLVLMDIQMDGMDGVEATRRIRRFKPKEVLPILALSASVLASERERGLAAGIDEFLSKPFDPDTLVMRIRDHMARRSAEPVSGAQPEVPSAAGSWPAVDGIDAADASARLVGDFGLFHRLLGALIDDYGGVGACGAVFAGAAPDGLAAAAHKLRGGAGSLGARTLSEAAGVLEQRIRDNEPWTDARDRVMTELARLAASYRALSPPAPPPVAQGERADLCRALLARDLRALVLYDTLRPALSAELGAERTGKLDRSIGALDFGGALALLG